MFPKVRPYPIRSITDSEFRYIRNLSPDAIYIEKHLMGIQGEGKLNNPYWGTWVSEASNNQRTYKLVSRYISRPSEELYKLSDDPAEMHNLANDPAFADRKARLAAALDAWMKSQGDPGTPQDTQESLDAARKGKHRFGVK